MLGLSCEPRVFDWPPFSGSVLSDFVLFLHSAASSWPPAGVSY